jgi:hypothetical protein
MARIVALRWVSAAPSALAVGALFVGGLAAQAATDAPQLPADFAEPSAWQSREVGDGVVLRFRWFERLFAGPQSLTVLDVQKTAGARFDVVAPGVRKKTSAMGQENGALAAINGGFFAIESTGLSLGLLRLDGALVVPSKPKQASLGIGDDGWLRLAVRPEGDWPEVQDALGAGPMLLVDGVVRDHGSKQRTTLHPRSAIGTRKDGSVVWLTADGRTDKAKGLAHVETAAILQALGCRDALNLDGGGSTALWVAGRGVVNYPCDNKKYDHAGERAVANAVLLRAPAVVVQDDDEAELRGDGWRREPATKGGFGPQCARGGEDGEAVFAAKLPFGGAWQVAAWLPGEGGGAGWRAVVASGGASGGADASTAGAGPASSKPRVVTGARGGWVVVGEVEVGEERRATVRLKGLEGKEVAVDGVRWRQVGSR